MDTDFLLPIRVLMHGKLLTVHLASFGDDPQQALKVLAGVGPQLQTVFYGYIFQQRC
jgi:hypothetical protein